MSLDRILRIIRRSIWVVPITLLLIIAGCGKGNRQGAESVQAPAFLTAGETLLSLPRIPDTISSPDNQRSYISRHFWDALDFSRDPRSRDTAFMEQNFANFIPLMAMTDSASAAEAAGNLLNRASVAPEASDLLLHIIDKYLDDPNSPMRNEELYIHFLQYISADFHFDEIHKIKSKEKLEVAMKNRPGTVIPDIHLLTHGEKKVHLHDLLKASDNLVIFYDSDCSHCSDVIKYLRDTPAVSHCNVIAIDVAGNLNLWERKSGGLPSDWNVTYSLDAIEDDDLIVFHALPTFYLLDSGGRILMKDPTIAALIATISQ